MIVGLRAYNERSMNTGDDKVISGPSGIRRYTIFIRFRREKIIEIKIIKNRHRVEVTFHDQNIFFVKE